MYRKKVTQIFPFLLPIRSVQRKMCFYSGMRFDGHRYAETLDGKQLPYKLFDANTGEIRGQKLLYTNKCKICYPLPENVEIKEAKNI